MKKKYWGILFGILVGGLCCGCQKEAVSGGKEVAGNAVKTETTTVPNAAMNPEKRDAVAEAGVCKELVTYKEIKYPVPGYSSNFFVQANGEIMSLDTRVDLALFRYTQNPAGYKEVEQSHPLIKYVKQYSGMRIRKIITRENGDYLLLTTLNDVIRITSDGKEKYMKDVSELIGGGDIFDIYYLGKGKTLVLATESHDVLSPYRQTIEEEQPPVQLYQVDLNEERLVVRYKDNQIICGSAEEGFVYVESDNKVGKMSVSTGKIVAWYSLKAIYDTASDYNGKDADGTIYFHDRPLTYATYKGKLFAKHVSGVFWLDEKNRQWVQIIDGKKDFALGATYNNTFAITGKNELWLMGYVGDDESATDFCKYEW